MAGTGSAAAETRSALANAIARSTLNDTTIAEYPKALERRGKGLRVQKAHAAHKERDDRPLGHPHIITTEFQY